MAGLVIGGPMPRYLAARELAIYGRRYAPGEPVPMEEIARRNPRLAGLLVDQRKVVPDTVTLAARPADRERPGRRG